MANTSSHPITVNGTRLDTYAYNIEKKDGWANIAGRIGSNAKVPGRHGSIWVPNKRHDEGEFILSMWVSHKDVDGNIVGSDPYFQFRKNLDALVTLLDSSYALLDVRQQIGPTPATDTRQAFCEFVGSLKPDLFGNQYGKFTVALAIPAVFWQDLATQDWAGPTGAGAISVNTVTTMAGATAPMEDLQFQVVGPITNPRVTDVATGHYVQLNATVSAGETWEVDASKWTTVTGTATGWTGTGTNRTSITTAVGMHSPRLFALAPGSAPSVQLGGSGTAAATQLKIRSRRKFK